MRSWGDPEKIKRFVATLVWSVTKVVKTRTKTVFLVEVIIGAAMTDRWKIYIFFSLLMIFIFGSWSVFAFLHPLLNHLDSGWKIEKLAQWGETFGALNALFAALAFVGVVSTLWLQRNEFATNLNEQHRQRFESHFFQLLALLRELRKEVKAPAEGRSLEGSEALKRIFDQSTSALPQSSTNASKADVAAAFARITKVDTENQLGPYFRITYSILRRTSEDPVLSHAEKANYGNLVRSQLSTAEIGLMGLNGLTEHSNDFEIYLTEFRLLKYLPEGPLRNQLQRFYPRKAFEARD